MRQEREKRERRWERAEEIQWFKGRVRRGWDWYCLNPSWLIKVSQVFHTQCTHTCTYICVLGDVVSYVC